MFKRHLLWQLFPAYLLIIIVTLLVITFYLSQILTGFYHDEVASDLKARARLIELQIIPELKAMNYSELDGLIKKLGKNSGTRITIILPTGQVVADSDENINRMGSHGDRPEFKDALEKGMGRNIRFSNTLGERMMYFALPIEEQGEILAVVRTSIPVTAINKQLKQIYNKIILGVLIVAIFAAGISLVISDRISRPIEQMKETAQRFASGELDLRVPIPRPVELAELAEALNEMARQLQDRIKIITEQRNESEAVLSSMTEGVLAVDPGGHIVSINKAAANFLQIDQNEARGRNIEEIIRNPDFQEFIQDVLNKENPNETDVVLSGQDGRIVRLDGAGLTDSTGQKSGAVIVISDITRIRRLENLRRDFVANVSHELRTPITSIKGFVETLLEGAVKQPQEAERFLKIIAKHSDRLNAIVEDLLILSSLEEDSSKRKIAFEKTPVKPVLDSVIQMSMIKAEEKKITIELDCDANIEARISKVLLEQAVLNLIDNAVKYSESGSRVLIAADRKNEIIAISVRDNGCGIAKKHQDRIFERFYVVDKSRSRKLGGTGLGLAIVKHIAEVHGGYVGLESSPGAGSTFTIYIPAD
jgi:two-component system phosphate regulon sensor histidine kinase PhoR